VFVECNAVMHIWINLQQWLVTCGFLEPFTNNDILVDKLDAQPIVNVSILMGGRCKICNL
jgi:hypothetical protein